MNKKKKWLLLLGGIIEAIIAIVCYSRGILNLFGYGGVRTIIGIVVLILLIAGYILMSKWYLSEPKKVMMDEKANYSMSDLKSMLSRYTSGRYFGAIARTVMNQLERIESSSSRVKSAIGKKFDKESMSYSKYYSIVDAAEKGAMSNVIAMTNRMQFFDEEEYKRLENYRSDNIPDDIQLRQIALYKENQAKIEQAVAVNENLILKLDTLTMELAKADTSSEENMDSMLGEIEQLTKEVKFYT